MTTTFALTDPLSSHLVRIHILVQPAPDGNTDRGIRPVTVAVGIEGAVPHLLTGMFDDLPALIDRAWRTTPSTTSPIASSTHPAEVIAQSPVSGIPPTSEVPSPPHPTQGILDLF